MFKDNHFVFHQSRSHDWVTLGKPPVNPELRKAAFSSLHLINEMNFKGHWKLKAANQGLQQSELSVTLSMKTASTVH